MSELPVEVGDNSVEASFVSDGARRGIGRHREKVEAAEFGGVTAEYQRWLTLEVGPFRAASTHGEGYRLG